MEGTHQRHYYGRMPSRAENRTMNPYDFVHLVLYAFDGAIQGRTKLQKTVYFIGALTDRMANLGYRANYKDLASFSKLLLQQALSVLRVSRSRVTITG